MSWFLWAANLGLALYFGSIAIGEASPFAALLCLASCGALALDRVRRAA